MPCIYKGAFHFSFCAQLAARTDRAIKNTLPQLFALFAGAFVSDEVDDRAEKCEAERSRGKGRDRASEGEGCLFCWRVWFQVASMRRRSNEACSLFVSCLLSFCRFAQIRLFRFVCSVVPDAQFVCSVPSIVECCVVEGCNML